MPTSVQNNNVRMKTTVWESFISPAELHIFKVFILKDIFKISESQYSRRQEAQTFRIHLFLRILAYLWTDNNSSRVQVINCKSNSL